LTARTHLGGALGVHERAVVGGEAQLGGHADGCQRGLQGWDEPQRERLQRRIQDRRVLALQQA
jgi:hypothetical protein